MTSPEDTAPQNFAVLLVEDNPGDADLVRIAFETVGKLVTLTHVKTMAAAVESVRKSRYDVALLDLGLPDAVGMEAIATFRAARPDIPLVVLTGTSDEKLGARALLMGAQDFFVKGRAEPDVFVGRVLSAGSKKPGAAPVRRRH